MFMLAEKQLVADEAAHRFWIDPEVAVALNAQINEHYHPDEARLPVNDNARQAQYALMDCYCRQDELADAGVIMAIDQQQEDVEGESHPV